MAPTGDEDMVGDIGFEQAALVAPYADPVINKPAWLERELNLERQRAERLFDHLKAVVKITLGSDDPQALAAHQEALAGILEDEE